jgi:hypothetical protein
MLCVLGERKRTPENLGHKPDNELQAAESTRHASDKMLQL